MIASIFAHNGLQTVMHAIRPLVASRRLVQTLVKASSSADAGSSSVLHRQAPATASLTVMLNEVQTRSILTKAGALVSTAIAGGQLLYNPMSNGRTSLGGGFWIMQYQARQMYAQLTSGCGAELNFTNSGYLGDNAELLALADKKGGELSTAAVQAHIKKHPEILTKAGFSKGDVVHVDHIWPKCKGGLDHPHNYCLMLDKVNCSFGGRILLEKFQVVGFLAVIQVLQYHLSALSRDLESCAIWMD